MLRRFAILLPLLASCGLLHASFEGTQCDDSHLCPDGLTCGLVADGGATHLGLCELGGGADVIHYSDDFEAGNLGQYQLHTQTAQDTLQVLTVAAHRGDGGFRAVDNDTSSGGAFEAYVKKSFNPPLTGDMFFRGWLRIVASTGPDTEVLKSEDAMFADGQWDVVWRSNGSLRLGAWVSHDEFYADYTDAGAVPIGGWHLIEVSRLGAQTPDASIELFVDGDSVQRLEHFNGAELSGALELGAFFQESKDATMTVDWDDVRLSTAPTPDRLALVANVPPGQDACSPFEVRMVDLYGDIRPAPYELVLESDAGIFSDPICNVPGAIFPAGLGRSTVYTKASDSVDVRHLDFLSSQLVVEGTPCGCSSNDALATFGALILFWRRNRRLSSGNRQLSRRA